MTISPETHSRFEDLIYSQTDSDVLLYDNFMMDWAEFVKQVGPMKIPTILDRVRVPWPPKVLALDLAAKCNLQCPICRYHGNPEAEVFFGGQNVNVDEVVNFLKKAGRAETISLGVTSEPFLNKDIWSSLERLRPLCRDFEFSTNALPLTAKSVARLAQFNVKTIRVSCDAGDADGYAKWRAGGRFDQFLEKLLLLVETFGDRVVFHSVLYEQNSESLLKVPDILTDVGLSYLEMNDLFETAVSRRNALSPLSGERLCRYLAEMLERCDARDIKFQFGVHNLRPEDAERLFQMTDGRLGCESYEATFSKGLCRMPWEYMNVTVDGAVNPCCDGAEGFFPKPSAFKLHPDKLFNSPQFLALRAMSATGFTPRVCHHRCQKNYDFKARG